MKIVEFMHVCTSLVRRVTGMHFIRIIRLIDYDEFRLKALDIVTMKELSKRVNVIPIIAKSDTTSKDELARFKTKILSELRSHSIDFYMFPTDDEAVAEQNRKFNSFVPFAGKWNL